ncbi:TIR domain-containing protein [Tenacibaculum ovolyticum]|uniref:TIR domain-containing protein n=1 Tax=Tenacibaculum ovolyticum TaxID=104270 RepID=UPI0007ECCBEF|nr:TIR domain-containing protein [Tenacibaculum ovolyticum]
MTKRKIFISYYHQEESYKQQFENLFDDIIVNKSVKEKDIDKSNHSRYTDQLIRDEYINQATILVVLIGQKTRCRKHVDWEISAALSHDVGDVYAGLVGIRLKEHSDYGLGEKYNCNNIPKRLANNLETGYASIHDWTDDINEMKAILDTAFKRRKSHEEKRVNSLPQMQENTCN